MEGAPGFGVAPDCDFVSRYWVGVSKNDNPSGKWNIYGFDTSSVVAPGGAADYTQMGFDSEAIFIGGNEFDSTTGDYSGAWTLRDSESDGRGGRGDSLAQRLRRLHGERRNRSTACWIRFSLSSRSATAPAGRPARS